MQEQSLSELLTKCKLKKYDKYMPETAYLASNSINTLTQIHSILNLLIPNHICSSCHQPCHECWLTCNKGSFFITRLINYIFGESHWLFLCPKALELIEALVR